MVQPAPGHGSRDTLYIDNRPYDPRNQVPLVIVLDSSKSEQRVPVQVVRYKKRFDIRKKNLTNSNI